MRLINKVTQYFVQLTNAARSKTANQRLIFLVLLALATIHGSALAQDFSNEEMLGTSLSTKTIPSTQKERPIKLASEYGNVNGWDYLFNLLARQGINPDILYRTFTDPRMPEFAPLVFNLHPSERHIPYYKRNSPQERLSARNFYYENEHYFKLATSRYQVPPSIILALLQIETRCGKFTGKDSVLYRLAKLASATAPDSIRESISFNEKKYDDASPASVKARALKLETEFLPHVVATFKIAQEEHLSPLDIKGSYGGAIGMPQFLPGHQYNYGVDGNNDGDVDLNSPPDAIFSVANYLNAHGWNTLAPSVAQKRSIIWNYNHSEPYVSTAIAMADALDRELRGLVAYSPATNTLPKATQTSKVKKAVNKKAPVTTKKKRPLK